MTEEREESRVSVRNAWSRACSVFPKWGLAWERYGFLGRMREAL